MGKKTIYNCDICREDKPGKDLFGVNFSNMQEFTLGGFGSTEGVHICFKCAKQLRRHLNSAQISKEIGEKHPDKKCFGCGFKNSECKCNEHPDKER